MDGEGVVDHVSEDHNVSNLNVLTVDVPDEDQVTLLTPRRENVRFDLAYGQELSANLSSAWQKSGLRP